MDGIMGEGSNITVNGSGIKLCSEDDEECTETCEVTNSKGEKVSRKCKEVEDSISSKDGAENFINAVSDNSKSNKNTNQSTTNAASTLETADATTRQQRSSKFYVGIMENISKMKAGEGSETKLNEAMNYLYRDEESEVLDTATGQVIKVKGSAMESPSLFAVLSGENINADDVKNYNTERIMNTVQNTIQNNEYADESYINTATSSDSKSSTIGRYVYYDGAEADMSTLNSEGVKYAVDSSLVNNSFETIKGVAAGEMLVEGAVNTSASLALASGATAGDAKTINEYAKLTNTVLAMDAEADRLNRSPLDITSKNTFLGSLVRKFAVEANRSGSFLKQFASFAKVTANAATSLMSIVRADEENNSYMKPYDGCERFKNIGAVATIGCSRDLGFDTSTLSSDIFNEDSEFMKFVEDNTEGDDHEKIKENSLVANFILYNNKRQTPLGVTDAGIMDSLEGENSSGAGDGSGKISLLSRIFKSVSRWLQNLFSNKEEPNNRIASGAAFVNSENNADWKKYKYAQRYVSLMRAKSSLRQYDGGENAYVNIPGLGGKDDPVIAFIKEHTENQNSIAAND